MTSFTDTTYVLGTDDEPMVCAHRDGSVAFFLPGYRHQGDGRGFCLRLLPCHIPAVQEFLATLTRQATILAHDPKEGD
jgi:hypothetical protein